MKRHIDDISLAIERIHALGKEPDQWREPWEVHPAFKPEIEPELEPELTGQEVFA